MRLIWQQVYMGANWTELSGGLLVAYLRSLLCALFNLGFLVRLQQLQVNYRCNF